MRKFYQPRGGRTRDFLLRENTYRRVWYIIADYPYLKGLLTGDMKVSEREASYISGGVTEQAVPLQAARYVKAIEEAQNQIPEEYIGFVMRHIIDRMPYKEVEAVSEKTMKIWVQRFIWHVASNLGEV